MSNFTTFSPDFKEFVELLNELEVRYLVVGGYAVGFYGRPRFTGDIDFWVKRDAKNATRLVEVFNRFGLASFGLTRNDFLSKESVIQIGHPPHRIDIVLDIDGVSFEKAYPNKQLVQIDGVPISFIGLEDLKKNKKATGRFRDLDDLENL